jgi:hypothetical protein
VNNLGLLILLEGATSFWWKFGISAKERVHEEKEARRGSFMSGCIDVGARRTWSARWKSCRRRPCSALYSLCSVYFIDCAGVGLQGACDTPAALILASARCRLRPPPSELFCSCLFIGRLRPETRRSENLAEISAT